MTEALMELQQLGCTAKEYLQGCNWLKKVFDETVERRPLRSPVYGEGVAYAARRKLTQDEFTKIMKLIKQLQLIVMQVPVGFNEGVAYVLYTNPQADRMAQRLPALGSRQGAEPQALGMLYWQCVDPRYMPENPNPGELGLIAQLFRFMEPYSHAEENTAWLRYCHLNLPTDLSQCLY